MSNKSADSEMLIRIKTILDIQGVSAAKTEINNLIQSTNNSKLAEGAANAEHEKSVQTNERAAHAVHSLHRALSSGVGPFRAIMFATQELGGSLASLVGRFTAVAAAAAIGWELGTKIKEFITGTKDAKTELEALEKASKELKDRVDELSRIRLENLKKDAEDIAKGFSTALDKADRLKRISDMREDVELAKNLAEVNLSFQKGEINPETKDRLENKFQSESERRKLDTESKSLNEKDALVIAEEEGAHRKLGALHHASENSQQEYDQAVKMAKEAGITDPSNPESEEYKKILNEKKGIASSYAKKLKYQKRENADPSVIAETEHDYQSAQSVATALQELPSLKKAADDAQKSFQTYWISPEYKNATEGAAVKKEEIRAQKSALSDKYKTSEMSENARDQEITNQITDEERKKELEEAKKRIPDKSSIQRMAAISMVSSLHLDPIKATDNAGLPVSEKKQAEIDSTRLYNSKQAIRMAGIQANQGVDKDQIIDQLIAALKDQHVRLTGDHSKYEGLLKDVLLLQGEMKEVKSQSKTAPGLN